MICVHVSEAEGQRLGGFFATVPADQLRDRQIAVRLAHKGHPGQRVADTLGMCNRLSVSESANSIGREVRCRSAGNPVDPLPLPVRPVPAAPGRRLVAARDQPFDDLADGLGSLG
jgi:hypothetical protein